MLAKFAIFIGGNAPVYAKDNKDLPDTAGKQGSQNRNGVVEIIIGVGNAFAAISDKGPTTRIVAGTIMTVQINGVSKALNISGRWSSRKCSR